MFASAQYLSPDMAYKAKLQEGELQRRQSDADTRNKQLQIAQDEQQRNTLTAENYALNQSHGMQSTDAPRVVTDTSMTIGGGGGAASRTSGSSTSRLPSGGFGSANPQIDGRYMSLVGFQQPDLNKTGAPPREALPQASFTPQDATAFQDAAFARLKDRAGSLGKGAIASLAAILGGRGIGDSGTFARGTAQEIVNAVQPLSDLNVEHLGQEYGAAQHARELAEQRATTDYSGRLTQRGQDISSMQAMNNLLAQIAQLKYQGEITQRGQDLDQLYRML